MRTKFCQMFKLDFGHEDSTFSKNGGLGCGVLFDSLSNGTIFVQIEPRITNLIFSR